MIAVDTNIIVYAVDMREPGKQAICERLMVQLAGRDDVSVPLQVLGELANTLRRRLKMADDLLSELLRSHLRQFISFHYTAEDILMGDALASEGVSSVWDGILLASCERMHCRFLISEDMQSGFRFGQLEVISPFADDGAPNPALEELLAP